MNSRTRASRSIDAGEGLPDPDVREGPSLVVDGKERQVQAGSRVERDRALVAQAADPVLADGGGDVHFPGHEGRDERVLLGESPEDQPLQAWSPAPVARVAGELDLAGDLGHEAKGAGAHRPGTRPSRRGLSMQ